MKLCKTDKDVKEMQKRKNIKKITPKPFNIEAAKAGKPVCTRDGRKARIICFDSKIPHYPIIALINHTDTEIIRTYTNKGESIIGSNWDEDLMMLPEKKEGWINIYPRESKDHPRAIRDIPIFNTKEEAEATKKDTCLATIKIEWKE